MLEVPHPEYVDGPLIKIAEIPGYELMSDVVC